MVKIDGLIYLLKRVNLGPFPPDAFYPVAVTDIGMPFIARGYSDFFRVSLVDKLIGFCFFTADVTLAVHGR